MKRSSLSLVLSLVLVFASGVIVGALGHRYFGGHAKQDNRPKTPEEYRQAYLKEMQSRLKLSADQTRKLNEILDETRARYRELRERDRQRPELKSIQEWQTAQVNAILSPEQQAEYDKMRREREEKKKAQENEKGRGR